MRKQIVLVAVFGLAALAAHAEVLNIDGAELARLAAKGVVVVDIRTAGEWQETGVIAGSRLITYVDENGRVDAPAWLEKVKAAARSDQPVILVCRSGNRTRAASQFLSDKAGYKTVYNASGGMNEWTREGRPVASPGKATAACAAGARC